MLTAICNFPLRPNVPKEQALKEMRESIPFYQGRPGLIRKYICINQEEQRGCGIYLWQDRKSAEAYFAEVVPIMRQQLGAEPQVTYFHTPVVVDNSTGEVLIET